MCYDMCGDIMSSKIEKLQEFAKTLDENKSVFSLYSGFNQFDILGVENTEIRHSRMLYWLFNANGNHGLGDNFVKAFFEGIDDKTYHGFEWRGFTIEREYPVEYIFEDDNCSMYGYADLTLKSKKHKTIIVIENKVKSWVHSTNGHTQLECYKGYFDTKYPNYRRVYYLLAPEHKSVYDGWQNIEYSSIVSAFDNVEFSGVEPNIRLFIENYCTLVKRISMNKELEKLCFEIFENYGDVINVINKTVTRFAIISEAIHCALQNRKDIIYIKNVQSKYHHFYSKEMDNYVYENDYSGKRSNCIYEFSIDLDKSNESIGGSILIRWNDNDKSIAESKFDLSNSRIGSHSYNIYTTKRIQLKNTEICDLNDVTINIAEEIIDDIVNKQRELI